VAGIKKNLFEPSALVAIQQGSAGSLRHPNQLASGGLVAAATEKNHSGDVRDPEACQRVIEGTVANLGRLDILVNGAAGNFLCPPEMLSPNGFKTVIDIDLNGTFNMCCFAFAHLKQTKSLILIISTTLHYVGTLFHSHVSAANAGIDALTINLAAEWDRSVSEFVV
jgi:NAD(P)-dependent dehydrogenase (short-subunit alcohol dehydrogenase family)